MGRPRRQRIARRVAGQQLVQNGGHQHGARDGGTQEGAAVLIDIEPSQFARQIVGLWNACLLIHGPHGVTKDRPDPE